MMETKLMTTPDDWLNLTKEEALAPDLPICDAHHHLFDHPNNRYLLDDFYKDLDCGHNVVKTVFLECMADYRREGPEEMRPVGETEFINAIAKKSATGRFGPARVAAGIVAYADLLLGDFVQPVLEEHLKAARTRFRGIRHACGWDESPSVKNSHTHPFKGLMLDSTFRKGFACLEGLGLRFDAWLYHTQLMEIVDLARAFPGTPIILNHVGGPLGIGPYAGKQTDVFDVWKRGILELAACPNVVVKLGGLAMPINGFGWHERETPPGSKLLADATAPYFLFCIEHFGVNRCMFESNFPVDKLSCSYTVLWNSFKRMTNDFSLEERLALFHDNAVRIYNI
jgi:L-fuconolactonase